MYNAIPNELKLLNQWVVWRYMQTPEGKQTKVPVNPATGWPASVTNPNDWGSYAQAVEASHRVDGIGFVFTDADEYCGIDLDHLANDPEGSARQELIFKTMDSYSERSPSKQGLHIIVKARIPHGRKRHGIEVYSSGRFFTMTGDVYNAVDIKDCQATVDMLWSQMGERATANYYAGDYTEHSTDDEIHAKAQAARNGDLYQRLWSGDVSGYFSPSEADLALVDIIAFYTKNRMQIQRMFLASGLGKRDKYANAKPQRLDTLMGYMINKSFDRMLPPVDFSHIIDQYNAVLASGSADFAGQSADTGEITAASPAPISPLPQPPSTDMWMNTRPPGLLGELVAFFYEASPRPVYELSLAGALGLMSGIVGRAYNVSETGLNNYIMALAPTGTGKEAIASGIDRMMALVIKDIPAAVDFIGPADIASGQGLLRHLSDRSTPCFVSVSGEIGLRLQQITMVNASSSETSLLRAILDLYSKSGANRTIQPTVYSDKLKNTEVIHSPAFSWLGDSTPEFFYRAIDEDGVTQGLVPRFLIIEYKGPRVPLNKNAGRIQPSPSLLKAMTDLCEHCLSSMAKGIVTDVQTTPEAQAMLDAIDKHINGVMNRTEREVLRQLWNRYHLKILKISAVLAVAQSPSNPVIDAHMVNWSQSLVNTDINRLSLRFEHGEVGGIDENNEQVKDFRAAVRWWLTTDFASLPTTYQRWPEMHEAKCIPHSVLRNKLTTAAFRKDRRGLTIAVNATIKDMVASGYIQEMGPKDKRDKFAIESGLQVYYPTDFNWFLRLSS